MRIAYICADPGVPVFGNKGCSIHVQEIVRTMLARGADVDLFAARQGGDAPPGLEDCTVHEMPIQKCATTRDREIEQVLWNQRVAGALKQCDPFDLVYERHSIWSAGALEWAKNNGIPSVLEVNAPLIEEQSEHRELVQLHLAHALTRRAMRTAGTTYVVSAEIVSYCQQFFATRQQATVIPNGVNTSRFSPTVAPADKSDAFTIGFVGTLKPWHGLDDLLAAFECLCEMGEHTNYRLLIVGDGPQRSMIESWIDARTGMRDRVHLTGEVDSRDVPGWLTAMDVAVVPYPELTDCYFSPLKIFEYMAAGLPIVASSTGQVREIIQHGKNGVLYPPGDVKQLAATLLHLSAYVPLQVELGQAARTSALSRDWNSVLDQVFSLAGLRSTGTAVSNIVTHSGQLHDEIQA